MWTNWVVTQWIILRLSLVTPDVYCVSERTPSVTGIEPRTLGLEGKHLNQQATAPLLYLPSKPYLNKINTVASIHEHVNKYTGLDELAGAVADRPEWHTCIRALLQSTRVNG